MMPKTVPLSEMISVRGRFLRSTHLERDYHNGALEGYHLIESAYNLLKAVSVAFHQPAQRAMTLVGPYGSGKSAFCAFLAAVSEKRKNARPIVANLAALDKDLAALLSEQKPLLPVLIVGSRIPLGAALVAGLVRSLEQGGRTRLLAQLRTEAADTFAAASPEPRQVADLYALAACLSKIEGAGGLLLVLDELGKFLEHAALHPRQCDIFFLQELAEAASRSGEDPLLVLGVLHQNPDAYAQKLGKTYQAEWAKVGERFRPLPLFPSDAEHLEMVARALESRAGVAAGPGFDRLAEECVKLAAPGMRARFVERARAAYPLHPLTLLALPALFRRTGQSHRSLFSFLAGEEPHAFGRFLRDTPYTPEAPPLFPPDRLFDYAAEMLAGGWGASGVARQWAEATELVERTDGISASAQRVMKCIGLLGILRDPRLRANKETLALALTESDGVAPDVEADLLELLSRRVVAYSRSRDLFRLWEGGDVDVAEEMAKARQGQQARATLHVAQELCPPPRLIARRHSYVTGALRSVAVQACGADRLREALSGAGDKLTVLLCLAQTAEEMEAAEAAAKEVGAPNLLIGLAHETDALREAAADVLAAAQVENDAASALAGDRAARLELSARRFEAETAFQDEWGRLFGPGEDGALWLYQGDVRRFPGSSAYSAFLSQMADRSYHAAPTLRNELINRRQLSSAAAAGRRSLIEAMLTRAGEARLGFKGFPPELSMYECVLRATGLHRETSPGVWGFVAPEPENRAGLRPCWDALADVIFSDPPGPRPVPAIYAALSAPPYGLTEGVLPVLLCAFLQVYAEETTLYREGTYLPEPGVADYEVMLRRPELFAVAGARLTGERALVVGRLAEKLNLPPYVVSVVRALLAMVRGLPEQAWKTQRLPETVLAMRDAMSRAKSPEQLLFHDLPLALGVTFFERKGVNSAHVEQFFTALNAALSTWGQALAVAQEKARGQLLEACGLPAGAKGWAELRRRSAALEGRVAHPTLLPIVRAAAEPGDDATVLEKVLAQVARRPPRTWTDMDADRFPGQAKAVGDLFQEAVAAMEHPVALVASAANLTDAQREQGRRVARQIKAQIHRTVREPLPPEILRAALVELLAELDE